MNNYIDTVRSLFSEPRQVIDNFLRGDRTGYTHPFLFCLIGAAAVILLNSLFVDFSITPQVDDVASDSEDLQKLAEKMQITSVRAATQFLPLSMFILLIISLSIGGILFLRDKTEGFYDQLIVNSYATGASFLALPLLIPVWQFSGQSLLDPFMNTTLPAMVIAGVILWIYRLYFNVDSFMDWIRILSSYITGFVIYVILIGILSAVAGYMIFAIERLAELSS
ncbi:hypothetical protein BH23BAC3_BH23BAC3_09290 [soil metagenome]